MSELVFLLEELSAREMLKACHELESWYLADLSAVEQALGMHGLAGKQNKSKYRIPDALANPAQELAKLTGLRYQKVGGSRAIGPHLDPDNTRSRSFTVFISGLRRITGISGGEEMKRI